MLRKQEGSVDNAGREYKFRSNNFDMLGFWIFFILSLISIITIAELYDMISRTLMDILGIWQLTDAIMFVFLFGPVLLFWVVIFNITGSKSTAIMYKDHMEINLKDTKHVIKYKSIANFQLRGLDMFFHLMDGSIIRVKFSLRLRIRDTISAVKLMTAIERELKRRKKNKKR